MKSTQAICTLPDGYDLVWSTYFGGEGVEVVTGLTILDNDHLIVVGSTNSVNASYTVASPFCSANNNHEFQLCDQGGLSYFDSSLNNAQSVYITDGFIASFNSDDELLWSTYFGGDNLDFFPSGNPVSSTYTPSTKYAITGHTNSSTNSFPTKVPSGAYFQSYSGGSSLQEDAFIAVFSNEFNLDWCSFFGGENHDIGNSVTFDSSGSVYMTGTSDSPDPTNVCSPPTNGEFPICTINPNLFSESLINRGISMTGSDAFIAKFDDDYKLNWSSYIGGSRNESGNSIICDNTISGSKLFFLGTTSSPKTENNMPAYFPLAGMPGYYTQSYSLAGFNDGQIAMFNLDFTTEINEILFENNSLHLFPNPASDQLHYLIQNLNRNHEYNLKIYDEVGRLIIKQKLLKDAINISGTIDTKHLTSVSIFLLQQTVKAINYPQVDLS